MIAIQGGIAAAITAQMTALWWWWWWYGWGGGWGVQRECEISSISSTCSYLGVSSAQRSTGLICYLEESRRVCFDCGQLWK